MFNTDVPTGNASCVQEGYATQEQGKAKCYVWDVLETCTQAEGVVLRSGKAVVKDWVLVGGGNSTA
jgi:hypothetical protein